MNIYADQFPHIVSVIDVDGGEDLVNSCINSLMTLNMSLGEAYIHTERLIAHAKVDAVNMDKIQQWAKPLVDFVKAMN